MTENKDLIQFYKEVEYLTSGRMKQRIEKEKLKNKPKSSPKK